MSNERIGKTRSGRVWHIVDGNETLCGNMTDSEWEIKNASIKSVKMCKGCMENYDEDEMIYEYESTIQMISDLEDEEVPSARPIKRPNPHQTW